MRRGWSHDPPGFGFALGEGNQHDNDHSATFLLKNRWEKSVFVSSFTLLRLRSLCHANWCLRAECAAFPLFSSQPCYSHTAQVYCDLSTRRNEPSRPSLHPQKGSLPPAFLPVRIYRRFAGNFLGYLWRQPSRLLELNQSVCLVLTTLLPELPASFRPRRTRRNVQLREMTGTSLPRRVPLRGNTVRRVGQNRGGKIRIQRARDH